MKLLVETAGIFQLQDDTGRKLIRHSGYTVVRKTTFIEWQTSLGNLLIIAQVGDEATDEEWRQYQKECGNDLALAVESFKSAFPPDDKYSLPTDPGEAATVKAERAAKRIPAPAPVVTPRSPLTRQPARRG